ncbi:MAG TPA: nuclear transport factor 2 family protein [Candidatus Angelobacter sp.]|nr:nuclear transport factor 2 family protein [Candidatus Angelobacter sp.]
MRKSLTLMLILIGVSANPGFPRGRAQTTQASPSPQPSKEAPQPGENQEYRDEAEEGIKHMLVSQIEAWNQGQLEAFMQGYWRSTDLTFFSGASITQGWEPTLQRYRQRYKSQGKEMGQLQFQDLSIDVMSRKAAVVTGKFQLTMSDGSTPHGLFTLVVKRMPGGWKIVHDHTSAAE